jgi:hypothetical protein
MHNPTKTPNTISEDHLKQFKRAYLEKYNPAGSMDVALSKSIKAAVQHNSLYLPGVGQGIKKKVRERWSEFLKSLLEKYTLVQDENFYLENIKELQKCMNKNCSRVFRDLPHPRFKTDPGFRISHSQKSISVFLKHLWCMNLIKCPPQCPVDAIILSKAGHRYPDTKWGFVNSIKIHQQKVDLLKDAKNDDSLPLAHWELLKF